MSINILPQRNSQNLIVKEAVAKIYELNEITDIVYNTIKETHDSIDDMIDDITDRHESITIEQHESITYEWNDEDNNNLYEILMKIYNDKIIDINKYNKEIFDINPLIERIVDIAKQLNKVMRANGTKIEIENLRRFLNSINLKETKINDTSRNELIQKATKFNIKPHHTNKIFNKLKEENDNILSEEHQDKEVSVIYCLNTYTL